MKHKDNLMQTIIISIGLWWGLQGVAQAAVNIESIKVQEQFTGTQLVFDFPKRVSYNTFTLTKPNRVVIDIKNVKVLRKPPAFAKNHAVIKNIRFARRNKHDVRYVIDLHTAVKMGHSMMASVGTHQLQIVLNHPQTAIKKTPQVQPILRPPKQQSLPKPSLRQLHPKRDIMIVIDPGHGGEDPGAKGRRGTQEKAVVLSIARMLQQKINRHQGIRAVLTRDGDYFVSLHKRRSLARSYKADLFISIHADASNNRNIKGSSVYVVSSKNTRQDARRWLTHGENEVDLMHGVRLDNKDDLLAGVLLDLSLTGTINVSTRIAENILHSIQQVTPVHRRSVQQARFLVLKSLDIPSVLVETAFISNVQQEIRLGYSGYQNKMANALLQGIWRYFERHAPPGTQLIKNSSLPLRKL